MFSCPFKSHLSPSRGGSYDQFAVPRLARAVRDAAAGKLPKRGFRSGAARSADERRRHRGGSGGVELRQNYRNAGADEEGARQAALPPRRNRAAEVALLAGEVALELIGAGRGHLLEADCREGGGHAAALDRGGGEAAFGVAEGEPGLLCAHQTLLRRGVVGEAALDLAVAGVEGGVGGLERLLIAGGHRRLVGGVGAAVGGGGLRGREEGQGGEDDVQGENSHRDLSLVRPREPSEAEPAPQSRRRLARGSRQSRALRARSLFSRYPDRRTRPSGGRSPWSGLRSGGTGPRAPERCFSR